MVPCEKSAPMELSLFRFNCLYQHLVYVVSFVGVFQWNLSILRFIPGFFLVNRLIVMHVSMWYCFHEGSLPYYDIFVREQYW